MRPPPSKANGSPKTCTAMGAGKCVATIKQQGKRRFKILKAKNRPTPEAERSAGSKQIRALGDPDSSPTFEEPGRAAAPIFAIADAKKALIVKLVNHSDGSMLVAKT
jgi:hypothetical protein